MSVLEGVRVLELGGPVAGAFCGRTLAGFGAQVIKIEPLGGDDARHVGQEVGGGERDPLYLSLNVGKEGITLNLEDRRGRDLLLRLVERADVLVENCPVGYLDERDLGFSRLVRANPSLVMVSISPFGPEGPYSDWRAYDLNCAAAGGFCLGLGVRTREPLTVPLHTMESLAGLNAAGAVLAALLGRFVDGRGQHVDIAVTEVVASIFAGMAVAVYVQQANPTERTGYRHPRSFPHAVLPCRDGYVALITSQQDQWLRFVALMDEPGWASEPRYLDRAVIARGYQDEVFDLIAPWLEKRTKAELFSLALADRVPMAPVRRVDEVLADEQLAHRGFFLDLDHEVAGRLRYTGAPFIFGETPWTVGVSAPRLGEHNLRIYGALLGLSGETLEELRVGGVI